MNGEDEKRLRVDGDEYRFSTAWIRKLEGEEHWRLYWQQARMMAGVVEEGQAVLEVGPGSMFMRNYLRARGVQVTTLDIDGGKHPDIVANVATYPFAQGYDHVLAFEVLEHIPFARVPAVLRRVRAACRGALFLSVPRSERLWLRLSLQAPLLGRVELDLASRRRRGQPRAKHHHWEVDLREATRQALEAHMAAAGFRIAERRRKLSRLFYRLEGGGAAPAGMTR